MPAPPTPEEILAQALHDNDPKTLLERWWNAGGDICSVIRRMQKKAPTCPRTRAVMRACGLEKVYPMSEGS